MPTEKEVRELLTELDKNGDNKVSVDELKAFLDSVDCKLDKQKVQDFIKVNDADKDGKLNLNELIKILSD